MFVHQHYNLLNMKNLYIVAIVLFIWLAYQKVNAYQLQENRMSVTQFKKAIAQKEIQLIDVRTLPEFMMGHIKNALQINVLTKQSFVKEIDKLDKNKPTYIYCRSGKRSLTALKIMRKKGFRTVYDLEDG